MRQPYRTQPRRQILLVDQSHALQLRLQRLAQAPRQRHVPILAALAVAHANLVQPEIHIPRSRPRFPSSTNRQRTIRQ
jgi:hypothetical protein